MQYYKNMNVCLDSTVIYICGFDVSFRKFVKSRIAGHTAYKVDKTGTINPTTTIVSNILIKCNVTLSTHLLPICVH